MSMTLILVALIPSFRRFRESKGYTFLCGVFAFAAAIPFGGLMFLGAGFFAPCCLVMWLIAGSIKFAEVIFMAKK